MELRALIEEGRVRFVGRKPTPAQLAKWLAIYDVPEPAVVARPLSLLWDVETRLSTRVARATCSRRVSGTRCGALFVRIERRREGWMLVCNRRHETDATELAEPERAGRARAAGSSSGAARSAAGDGSALRARAKAHAKSRAGRPRASRPPPRPSGARRSPGTTGSR